MLVQERAFQRVEGFSGLVRVPALGHRGTASRRRSRPSRSSVRMADAFATAARPDVGSERARRRSSTTDSASRSLLPGSLVGVTWVVPSAVFSTATHSAVSGIASAHWRPSPSRVDTHLEMSQENVELVRSICAAWDRGDYRSVGWADPEIEFVTADGPQPGTWKGLAGMAKGWRTWLSAWEDFRQRAVEYRELDDERVLVSFRASRHGKTSGLDLAQVHPLGAGIFHVREGRVTRFVVYVDQERALEAVGLRE